jgi:hypothetical protein
LDQSVFDSLWQVKRQEPSLGVKVIFALFVDNANEITLLGSRMFKDFVDLSQFKRFFGPLVLNTDRELLRLAHADSRKRLIFILRFPIPCASNQ